MKEIDIYITAMASEFSFQLDENTPLGVLAEEVVAIICQKEQCELPSDSSKPMFYSRQVRKWFDPGMTLSELGIKSGDKLCLV